MMTISQTLDLALQRHQSGHWKEAEALYREILALQPNHADALHFLGVLAHQSGRNEMARQLIRQAILLEPQHFAAYSNLGEACRAMGRLDEAVAAYGRALELQPEHAEAYNNLGLALVELGRNEEAMAACRRAIQLKLQFAQAHNNLGLALAAQSRFEEAIAAYRMALACDPNLPEAWNNLGNAVRARGEVPEAVAAYRRAIELRPNYAEAYQNLAVALTDEGKCDEAIDACHRMIEIMPQSADAYNNLGNALRHRAQLDEAIATYRRALELKPGFWEAESNLGSALRDQADHDGAIAAYRRALQMKPDDSGTQSSLIYAWHFHPGQNSGIIAEEKRRWNQQRGRPMKAIPHQNIADPERRLRIGYVSPDFCDHVVGRNLRPLLACHNRESFEILCYSGAVRPDSLSEEFRACADVWRNTGGIGDEALAGTIAEDGVDILVDVTQHMAGNRLTMFAYRPAPVQMSFAAYPESTGVEAIPYRISDRYLEGGQRSQGECQNDRVCLVNSFWCYDPCGMAMAINEAPAVRDGWVTFGSLNNFCKTNERVLRLWARVLREVKGSRLVILSPFGGHRGRALGLFESEGIEAMRVEFVEPCPRREYLEIYHRLDIALDSFPYGGHTTSLDALWMGVPVVSLAGQEAVSRAGLSQLSNLGLGELVAYSESEYVEIAGRVAGDLARLAELRVTLRARMEASVLMDAPGFAHKIETAYRAVWWRWCATRTGT